MTLGFAELETGESVELKGPIGHFTWLGNGRALLHGKERDILEIGMVCAGSGITPILQVLRGIFEDESDNETKVWVLDVNRHFDDILCKEELDALVVKYPSRLRVRYSLTGKPVPSSWDHSIGRINSEMLQTYLPRQTDKGIICICGPPPMEQSVKGQWQISCISRSIIDEASRDLGANGLAPNVANCYFLIDTYVLNRE